MPDSARKGRAAVGGEGQAKARGEVAGEHERMGL